MAVERKIYAVPQSFGVTHEGFTVRMWKGDVELTDAEVRAVLSGVINVFSITGGLVGLAAGVGSTLLIQRIAR